MTSPKEIFVRYTVNGKPWEQHIPQQVLLDPENSRAEEHKQMLINASKEYLAHCYGEGGTYEVLEYDIRVPLRDDPNGILVYDAEKKVFLLKVNVEQLQCIRAGLIELAERKHPTSDWQRARELYDKVTERYQKLLGIE